MKKTLLICILSLISVATFAQSGKVAYIYSEKVFKSMPEYDSAIKQIEAYAKTGKETSKAKLEEVEKLFKEFQQVESSLSSTSRESLKNQIIAKEKDANEYADNFFKEGGTLEQKQKELMKPIEDKVISAVNAIATEKDYDMIFDLSTTKSTIYQKAQLDITNDVITKIK